MYNIRILLLSDHNSFPSPTDYYFGFTRCEVGTSHWIQCNDTPVKFARFPVTGLVEGRSYIFRVRAVNKCGMSHPSRVSEPVAAMDPADRARKGVDILACTSKS